MSRNGLQDPLKEEDVGERQGQRLKRGTTEEKRQKDNEIERRERIKAVAERHAERKTN